MQNRTQRITGFGVFVLAGLLFLPGCVATRKFARNQDAALETRTNKKIDDTNRDTNKKIDDNFKETGERIDGVDVRAKQGIADAASAKTAAATADAKAVTAQQAAATANQGVQAATTRIVALDTKVNSLNDNYTVSGQPQSVTFKVGSAVLSDDAKKALDGIAGQTSGKSAGYMLELQGYTDSTGSESLNATLSQQRAESVLRYLVSKNVPLFRISIVGLGEANPVADNKTKAGREQNRRVEVRTLTKVGPTSTN